MRLLRTVLVLMAIGLTACDGVYLTKQSVELVVRDRATGEGAKASIAIERLREQLNAAGGNHRGLNKGASDAAGHAAIEVDTSVIVGGLFAQSEFGAFTGELDDRVSGRRYFIQVRDSKAADVIELLMLPQAKADGQRFTVEVVSIGKACCASAR